MAQVNLLGTGGTIKLFQLLRDFEETKAGPFEDKEDLEKYFSKQMGRRVTWNNVRGICREMGLDWTNFLSRKIAPKGEGIRTLGSGEKIRRLEARIIALEKSLYHLMADLGKGHMFHPPKLETTEE